MHEQSETIQDAVGKWINVFGRKTKQAGQPLPQRYEWEKPAYDTVEEATAAAKRRSEQHGREQQELRRLEKGKSF